jgi:anti-sigma-K factor RskA
MPLYVADALEESERQALRAHLASGCPRCAGALTEAQAAVARLPEALPPQTPSPAARDRLLARAAANASRPAAKPGNAAAPPRRLVLTAALAACVGAIIAGLAVWAAMRPAFDPITAPELTYVSLRGADQQPKAHGRVFWDRQSSRWHVSVFDLKPPPAGRTYELWFITPQQKMVPAGTFDVDLGGRGSLVVSVPPGIGPIALAAVTEEPTGGSPQPTSVPQLEGEVK